MRTVTAVSGREVRKRLASGAEREVDFAALVRDAVEELEMLTPDNWEEKCADLADVLREAGS